jgi:ectoine hydroxylase-related dioxygenase (phytanoyl-CoA dioxygenase family)
MRIFHEHVLVKEPKTSESTSWHHDQPYYCVDGEQVCSIWLPLDPVPKESGLEFVAGSHLLGKMFMNFRNDIYVILVFIIFGAPLPVP